MATIFPLSASVGQVFNGYEFNGTSWNIIGISLTEDYVTTQELENSLSEVIFVSEAAPSDPKINQLWVDLGQ